MLSIFTFVKHHPSYVSTLFNKTFKISKARRQGMCFRDVHMHNWNCAHAELKVCACLTRSVHMLNRSRSWNIVPFGKVWPIT